MKTHLFFSLVFCLSALSAFAEKLSPQELDLRKSVLAQDYKNLSGILPLAHQNPRFNSWLEKMHFSKSLFAEVENEVHARAKQLPGLEKIEYHLPDSMLPECHRSIQVGVGVETVAFATRDHVVHFCRKYFSNHDHLERAKILLHEQIHVVGIGNECDTESVAFLTFYAASKPTKIAYLHRCAQFKTFIEELMAKDEEAKRRSVIEQKVSKSAESKPALKSACDRKDLKACERLADLEYLSGKKSDAKVLYRMACDAKFTSSCRLLGQLEKELGNVPESQRLLTKACQEKDLKACVILGSEEEKAGKRPAAKKRFQLACDADFPPACGFLGSLEMKDTNGALAKNAFKKGCSLKDPLSCEFLGAMLEQVGDTAGAKKAYQTGCEAGAESSCKKFRGL